MLVFLGGGAGSLLRLLFTKWFPPGVASFPTATFLANFLASLLAGFLASLLMKSSGSDWPKYLLFIGFCGGLSTFSTFSVENISLMENGKTSLALFYIFATIFLTFFAAWGGFSIHKAIFVK